MSTLGLQRRAVATVLVVGLAVIAVALTGNTLLRPGCSLLPVSMPDASSSQNQAVSSEQACAALGRPLPRATALPDGVSASIMSISAPPAGLPRMVSVGYARDGHNVALLEVVKGASIPEANAGEVNASVAGAPAIVKQTYLSSANVEDVSYVWARDGLFLVLHVQLTQGIARDAADAMAASIR